MVLNGVWSRMGLMVVGTSTAAAWFVSDEERWKRLRKRFSAFAAQQASYYRPSAAGDHFAHAFPITNKWDENWDSRNPLLLLNMDEYEEADAEKRKEMLDKVTASSRRNIFLIRHGQYNIDGDKRLTVLGREQAELLGKRLSESGIEWTRFVMSTKVRATETANLAADSLPKTLKISSDSMLEEGAPYPPEPPSAHWKPQHKFLTDGARIEAAFRKYIHRASPKQKGDTYELVICHANVIRYFVCRALQYPPEGWLRISLANTSITWILITPSGDVVLKSLGDVGHLPPKSVTYS